MNSERGKKSTRRKRVRSEAPEQQATKIHENSESKASSAQEPDSGYTARQMLTHQEEKKSIAKYVVKEFIKDDMCIFLDAGSTVRQVGLTLFDEAKRSGLMIMTNNMLVFNEFTGRSFPMFQRGNVLALTGGGYNKNHEALFGAAVEALKSFNPLAVIIGTSGFLVDEEEYPTEKGHQGAFYHDIVGSEVLTKRAIAGKPTGNRVVVCDYSKIGIPDASCFATIEELAQNTGHCTIVTSTVPDNLPPGLKQLHEDRYDRTAEALRKLSLQNVNLIRVNYEGEQV